MLARKSRPSKSPHARDLQASLPNQSSPPSKTSELILPATTPSKASDFILPATTPSEASNFILPATPPSEASLFISPAFQRGVTASNLIFKTVSTVSQIQPHPLLRPRQ